jgi:hypothetical protein
MTDDSFQGQLDASIAYALEQFGYPSARSLEPEERKRYLQSAARAVREHIERSWVLEKRPPHQIGPKREESQPSD